MAKNERGYGSEKGFMGKARGLAQNKKVQAGLAAIGGTAGIAAGARKISRAVGTRRAMAEKKLKKERMKRGAKIGAAAGGVLSAAENIRARKYIGMAARSIGKGKTAALVGGTIAAHTAVGAGLGALGARVGHAVKERYRKK